MTVAPSLRSGEERWDDVTVAPSLRSGEERWDDVTVAPSPRAQPFKFPVGWCYAVSSTRSARLRGCVSLAQATHAFDSSTPSPCIRRMNPAASR